MRELRPRTDLPEHVQKYLRDLFERLGLPHLFQRLRQEVLTPQEYRLFEKTGISEHSHPQEGASEILRIVAEQRGLTLERTTLELARSLDVLGSGRYERLRQAIGEPITEMRDIPEWDAEAGELRFRNQIARRVDIARGTNIRLILDVFQEENWPPRIDSPFPPKSPKLAYAIESLNEGLSLIKFARDGTGGGLNWHEL
jgi:hypothetical protein